jgi:hypothetical protein
MKLERVENINWSDRVRNEVLHRVKDRNILKQQQERRLTVVVTSSVGTAF